MFPAFLKLTVDEVHLEMASREFSEIELIAEISQAMDVAVGVIDVKSIFPRAAGRSGGTRPSFA
jgi:5-methyltetrahydropteroyltriglutamate--homocysteine methyltransferase